MVLLAKVVPTEIKALGREVDRSVLEGVGRVQECLYCNCLLNNTWKCRYFKENTPLIDYETKRLRK